MAKKKEINRHSSFLFFLFIIDSVYPQISDNKRTETFIRGW